MGFKDVFRFGPPKDDAPSSSKGSESRASKGAKGDANDEPLTEQHGWTTGSNMATKATVGVLWLALLAGPIALGMRFLAPPAQQIVPTGVGADQSGYVAAVSEFAERAVVAWLETPTGTDEDTVTQYFGEVEQVRPRYPWLTDNVSVAHVEQLDNGLWSVVVGADVTLGQAPAGATSPPADPAATASPNATETPSGEDDDSDDEELSKAELEELYSPRRMYFQLPIYLAADGAMLAQSLPAPVAEPGRSEFQELEYGNNIGNTHPIFINVSEFLTAMLTSGNTDKLRPYTTPGTEIAAIEPAPFTEIRIDGLRASINPGADDTTPTDAQTIEVLATVRVTAANGEALTTQYALMLTARQQRWEVTTVHDSPLLEAPIEGATGTGIDGSGPGGNSGTGNNGGSSGTGEQGDETSTEEPPAGDESGNGTDEGVTEPPSTEPPGTEPPATEPPATEPPPADQQTESGG